MLWVCVSLGAAAAANELSGTLLPFLRRSFLRLLIGFRHLRSDWQVGEAREEALVGGWFASCRATPGFTRSS